MNRLFLATVIAALTFSTVSEAKTRLLVEVSQTDTTGKDIQEFLSKSIEGANSTTNITATVSDVNECNSFSLNTCSEYAKCTNLVGSFVCECPPGFIDANASYPGTNCSDINECLDGTSNCSKNSDCSNNIGSYNCICRDGFIRIGSTCLDFDECSDLTTHNCSENANCFNNNGGFSCSCKPGFTGDGYSCTAPTTTTLPTTYIAATSDMTIEASRSPTSQISTTSKMSSTGAVPTATAASNNSKRQSSTSKMISANAMPTITILNYTNEELNELTGTQDNTLDTTPIYESRPNTATSPLISNPTNASALSVFETNDVPTTRYYTTATALGTAPHTTSSEPKLVTSPATEESTHSEHTKGLLTNDTTDFQSSYTTITSTASTKEELNTAVSSQSTKTLEMTITFTSEDMTQNYTEVSYVGSSVGISDETQTAAPSQSPTAKETTPPRATDATVPHVTSERSNYEASNSSTTQPMDKRENVTSRSIETTSSEWQTDATVDNLSTSTIATTADLRTATTSAFDVTRTSENPQSTSKVSPAVGVSTELQQSHETTSTEKSESSIAVTIASTTSPGSTVTLSESSTTTSAAVDTSASHPGTTTATNSLTEMWTSSYATTLTRKLTSATTTTATSAQKEIKTEVTSGQTAAITTTPPTARTLQSTASQAPEASQIPNAATSPDVLIATSSNSLPPLKLPAFNGSRDEFLDALQNLLDKLTINPSQKIDISDAGSTLDNFQKLLSAGDVDENLVNITTGIVMAFFDASVENDEVKMTADDSEKITRFIPQVLETMNLTSGVYSKVETSLALQAEDINFSLSNNATFEVAGGSVVLPKAFIDSTTDLTPRTVLPTANQRVAFTRYSDSRFFSSSNVGFIMSGGNIASTTLPAKPSIINSPVIGASVAAKNITDSEQQATIRLNVLITEPLETNFDNGTKEVVSFTGNPQCVWWDYESRDWSKSDCVLENLSNGTATCKCNHLTSFAVIMTVEKTVEDQVLTYLSYVGAGLSIAGLVLTIITYTIFRTLRKSRSKRILLHFCVALCGVYITYVLGIAAKLPASQGQCIASGFFMHFFTLSVMAWMSVEVFDMYMMFVKIMQISIHKYLLKASLIAWLSPLVAAIIPLIVYLSVPGTDIYPIYHDGTTVCWLGQTGMLYAFIIPSSFILMVNLVLFSIVLRNVTCKRNDGLVGRIGRRSGKNIKASQHVINALALLLLAGPTWIIGYLINVEPVEDGVLRRILSYIFVILNAFQGFWICIVFCVRPPSVRNKWVNLIRRGKRDDRLRPYYSNTSQRNTTKATSTSPRPSLFPDSSVADETVSASTSRKPPVINTYSSSSSNSNNSNAKSSTNSSTSPLTLADDNNGRKDVQSHRSRPADLNVKIRKGHHRRLSISSGETASVTDSELTRVVQM